MEIDMKKLIIASAIVASSMAGSLVHAANDGTAGATSTGDLLITVDVADVVRITNLADIDINFAGVDISGTSPACVYRNGSTAYTVTATTTGPTAGAFNVEDAGATESAPYSVAWNVGASSTPLTYNSAATFSGANNTDDTCGAGAANNAEVEVGILATDFLSISAGTLTSTLVLTIAPI